MPMKLSVDHLTLVYDRADPAKGGNFSPVAGKTGGKSIRTKNIRSATPRGFAQAVFESHCVKACVQFINSPHLNHDVPKRADD